MLALTIILNECIPIFHKDRYREACEVQWRATVRVQHRGPGAKITEVEARVALVCASTNDGRPLIGGTNLIWTVVDWVASGSGPCTNGTHKCPRNLAHDFGVSPCMCNHVSYPSWRF